MPARHSFLAGVTHRLNDRRRRSFSRRRLQFIEDVAGEWAQTRQLGWSPRYAALVMGRLEADIFPTLGQMEISAITPRMICTIMIAAGAGGNPRLSLSRIG
jgi:hypothetical protein